MRAQRHRLGLRVTDLGMSALNSTALREHARPYSEELSRQSSYTVSLSVLDRPEIGASTAYVAPGGARARSIWIWPWARLPAYCTAMGKLLLAASA